MSLALKHFNLDDVLNRALSGCSLTYPEVLYLLSLGNLKDINKVMTAARQIREKHFGNKVFLYGFIYFSTYCKNQCTFCYYRNDNNLSPRYRKSLTEVTEIAVRLGESGVHLIDLTMGEDPLIHNTGNFDILLEMIQKVKEKTGLPLMISPGVVPDELLRNFSEYNVDWYALYQETHNRVLYEKLRVGQSFFERCQKRETASRAGMLVEDGMLIGVGETFSDRAEAILSMRYNSVQQVRVMSLVPQKKTPLAQMASLPRITECLCISVMRLAMPDRLIPASLDVDGIKGLEMRLQAGANVVTSIIPASSNLAGVSQSSLDIEQGMRSVPEVKKILNTLGMRAAEISEYLAWLAVQKANIA